MTNKSSQTDPAMDMENMGQGTDMQGMDSMTEMSGMCSMMMGHMEGMGWMMGGMTLIWILVFVLLVLGIAALIKYLFFYKSRPSKPE